MKLFNRAAFTILLLLVSSIALPQSLAVPLQNKIDSIFSNWSSTSSPGCVIGVVRNDSLIYAKGYGMSNLEYDIINTPETIYHMASVSKQFTAYAIVLLASDGKLNLDDDIHKYLPWFPDLKAKITIRNLLNHTSGIRDQWELLAIAGTRLDDVITQEQIIKILSKQQALNFTPGDENMYSNSGFTLLAEIVKVVSGESLRKFTDSAIFKPLGMNHTHFHDDYTEIEKNRAYSYQRQDDGRFANSVLSYSTVGPSSLFTNVDDMSKWLMNFYDTKVGNATTIAELTRKLKLNNGSEMSYAEGIVVDTYRDQKIFWHNWADAGYRTFVGVFPELKMGFIVFSNLDDFDTFGKAGEMANLFIPAPAVAKASPLKLDSSNAVLTDTLTFRKFAGLYIADDGVKFGFKLKNSKLYWMPPHNTWLLTKTAKDTFTVVTQPTVKFRFEQRGKSIKVDEYWPNNHRLLYKYVPDTSYTNKQLMAYTGTYYSAELDCSYGIVLKDHHLVLTNSKYDDAKLTFISPDNLTDDMWWIENIKILRDGNEITGFEVNSNRIKHLLFKKLVRAYK